MVDLSKYRGVFAKLYSDRFDVYRYGVEIDENGASHNVRHAIPALQGIRCLASTKTEDSATPRPEALLLPNQSIAIHCRPECDLFCGDYLVVKKYRAKEVVRVYYGTIGEPKVYPTHIEVQLKIDKSEVPNG